MPQLPAIARSPKRVALRVTAAAERTLRQGHPWLYREAIRRQSHEGAPGDLAVIFDSRQRFLAVGLYDPDSPIRVRVLQANVPAPIDQAWFASRLARAAQRRAALSGTRTTGYRLVHGENDGLPGLVVDRYDRTLVMKLYSAAWVAHLRDVLAALDTVMPSQRVVLRLSRAVAQRPERLGGLEDGCVIAGAALRGPIVFEEHALRFEVDPMRGQKTGFFLDQRDNRLKLGQECRGASVLDAFSYAGGFSVYAARGGAASVTSLDASRPALTAARRNMALNARIHSVAAAKHRLLEGDVFDTLERLAKRRNRFDVVVLDPPAFAKTQAEAKAALAAYEHLARAGLGVLRSGGLLVQSSCSSHVGTDAFFAALHRGAARAKRPLRELARTGHPVDHPVGFAQGEYLKCLFAKA